jgi:stage II sporulation protein AA (anti-sigma F factor antagonist)
MKEGEVGNMVENADKGGSSDDYAGYYYMLMRDSLIIGLDGDLDHHLADGMRDSVDAVIRDNNIRSIVMDFTNVDFMDSSGIGLIMGRYKRMKQRGVIAIVNPGKGIQRILQISGLHKLVQVFGDLESAIAANEARVMDNNRKRSGV